MNQCQEDKLSHAISCPLISNHAASKVVMIITGAKPSGFGTKTLLMFA